MLSSLGLDVFLTVIHSDDDEDETAELQRELEKIKRERAEKREQEVRINFPYPCPRRLAIGGRHVFCMTDMNVRRNEKRPLQKRRSGNMILRLAILS